MHHSICTETAVHQAVVKCVAYIVKTYGYDTADRRAIEVLANTAVRYMLYTCGMLRTQCETARRAMPTLVDAVAIMKGIKEVPASMYRVELEEEEIQSTTKYTSKLSEAVEYPHTYPEFYPRLPPAHTFKNTPTKRRITDDKAQKSRLRNEQSTKIVDNLFCIMKKTKKHLAYANYLL